MAPEFHPLSAARGAVNAEILGIAFVSSDSMSFTDLQRARAAEAGDHDARASSDASAQGAVEKPIGLIWEARALWVTGMLL